MLKYLLDSNAISEPLRPRPSRHLLERLDERRSEVATAATVWNELVFGMERLPASRRRDAIARYLDDLETSGFPILPYDRRAARWHGVERARLAVAGRTVSYADGQIAAVARVNGLTLVTANLRELRRFEGLAVETWLEA